MKKSTNTKEVKKQIRAHIQEFMTPLELKANAEALIDRQNPTLYHAVRHMAEGGSFLCYYDEVKDFLNSLGINPDNKKYSDEKSWELYCHLIARDSELLIKHAN